ncbi:hypothetical protein [Dysgonomonas termitidis]|uniref:Uncharacterized protein n=1 Tax=Dysgonomonas termitidis TaxID=1516126 RepID=A0ABV9KUD3_9BACT
MGNIKCITFDREAQEALPEHIKAKMKADREKARAEADQELREAALPLIKFLNEKHHPHAIAIVSVDSVEIMEGVCIVNNINDFIND